MRKLSLVVIATLMAGAASAAVPVFRATCPDQFNVDADRTEAVYINGKKAAVKKVNNSYYEARAGGATIGISLDPGAPPSVSYTGQHGANGMCQVADDIPSGSGQQASRASSSERAGQGKFDATGNIPCAQHKGQPMNQQCPFAVARDGGGSATVVVTRPDGRKRAIFFEKGKAISADLSQADGNMTFRATKKADLYQIQAGDERYEIPEAVVFGG